MDPHIFADSDPDPGSQNLVDPTDPNPDLDPKHCFCVDIANLKHLILISNVGT